MSSISVFATATSTIHADLIVVSLKRVGISTSGISVLYPSDSRPDSVLYWVNGETRFDLSPTGKAVTVSGPLRLLLEQHHRRSESASIVEGLRSLGLSVEQSMAFEATLLANRVVLSTEAKDENELALIFHILHHIGAEKIVLTEAAPMHNRMRHTVRPSRRRAEASMSLSAA
ncbi:MAG: hypothetical protein ABIO94_02245 [Opitutaceae bacterium]